VDEVLGEQENHGADANKRTIGINLNLSLKLEGPSGAAAPFARLGFMKTVGQSGSGLAHRRLSTSLMPPPPPLTPRPNTLVDRSGSTLPLRSTSSNPVLSTTASARGPSVCQLLRSPSLEVNFVIRGTMLEKNIIIQ
jgi:hypothetical protein